MSKSKETQTQTPAKWASFPEMEKFFDEYVNIFWGGKTGSNSYYDMLISDIEFLKKAYLQNNTDLTNLESAYMDDLKRSDYGYEKEIRESQIPIRFGGGPAINLLPKASKYTAENVRSNKIDLLGKKMGAGNAQAGRIMDFAAKFPPNRANTEYMEYLKSLGMKGQDIRTGIPTLEGKGSYDDGRGLLGNVADFAHVGKDVMDIYKGSADKGLWTWAGNKISDWWSKI